MAHPRTCILSAFSKLLYLIPTHYCRSFEIHQQARDTGQDAAREKAVDGKLTNRALVWVEDVHCISYLRWNESVVRR
ncbi:hypothetical protein BDU57DRAFT_519994, partial [Ampelomyces quisqualis]